MVLRILLFASVVAVLFACGTSGSSGHAPEKIDNNDPEKLYAIRCNLCHGADGKLGVAGASDLSISKLNKEESIAVITNGRGTMTPFKDMLSAEEINSLAEYIGTLREN